MFSRGFLLAFTFHCYREGAIYNRYLTITPLARLLPTFYRSMYPQLDFNPPWKKKSLKLNFRVFRLQCLLLSIMWIRYFGPPGQGKGNSCYNWNLSLRHPCKGKPTPKIAENKVQETLHFRYLKILVKYGVNGSSAREIGVVL